MDGGIFALLRLIAVDRGAVEYDLRHRFRIGLRDIGDTVTIHEVARLVKVMASDPSSAIAASASGWDYPISRETLAILDLFDLTAAINSDRRSRPRLHTGRPFNASDNNTRRVGNAAGRSPEEIRAILNSMGHALPA